MSRKKGKTVFERMPSPSGFGEQRDEDSLVGRQKIQAILKEIPEHLLPKKVEGNTAVPYADFTMPELVHMNTPYFPNYLPQIKPRRMKIILP